VYFSISGSKKADGFQTGGFLFSVYNTMASGHVAGKSNIIAARPFPNLDLFQLGTHLCKTRFENFTVLPIDLTVDHQKIPAVIFFAINRIGISSVRIRMYRQCVHISSLQNGGRFISGPIAAELGKRIVSG
jgi:hypothetical protein